MTKLDELRRLVQSARESNSPLWSWINALSQFKYIEPALLEELNNTPQLLQPLVEDTATILEYPNLYKEAEEVVRIVVALINSGVDSTVVSNTLKNEAN